MGENSSIQWTTHTFNPWVGCQRVSPGCEHCYAESYDKRVGGVPKNQRADPKVAESRWGPKGRRVRTAASNWKKPLAWDKAAEAAGERQRVFCSSLADVFEDRPEFVPWREDLFGLIASTRSLDWLLLTKRPENIARLWPATMNEPGGPNVLGCPRPGPAWWPNIWLGTTVEDQQRADERIPELLKVRSAVRFLSCEPLLERVDLDHENLRLIDWVIIGGESGAGARPFALDWARDLIQQCRGSGPAPFVKQLGARVTCEHCGTGRAVCVGRYESAEREAEMACNECCGHGCEDGHCDQLRDPAGGDMAEWPSDLRVREFPR